MSKTAHRAALFASSSIIVASIVSAVTMGVMLAPSTALAANECGPLNPAPTPDNVNCPNAAYGSGITYTSQGDLTLATTSVVSGGPTIGGQGIRLTGVGADALTFNSAVEVNGVALNGALVDLQTTTGTITVSAAALDADASSATSATHAVRARSTSGAIVIGTSGAVGANGGATGSIGIEAVTAGGISITAGSTVAGRLRGILTDTTSGAGSTTIRLNAGSVSNGATVADAAIEARSGSGAVVIDFVGGAGNVLLNNAGLATINVGAGLTWGNSTSQGSGGGAGFEHSVAIPLAGVGAGPVIVNNSGRLLGQVNMGASTGDAEVRLLDGSVWRTNGQSTFGTGDDSVVISQGAIFGSGSGNNTPQVPVTRIDFGPGSDTDTVSNAGIFIVGVGRAGSNGASASPDLQVGEVHLLNLTSFTNSGAIMLGAQLDVPLGFFAGHTAGRIQVADLTGTEAVLARATDWWPDDILLLPGASFIGAGGRIVFDVNLMATGQQSCDPALRASNGDMPAADCVSIEGGSTAGTSFVAIHDLLGADRGIFNPQGTVLIDVSGGTSAAEHFVLDPESDSYSAAFGGVIDKGIFFYPLIYDEDTQQHKLVGLVGGDGAQFPLLASAAHSLWRVSTGSWLERQADLRGGLDAPGGVWLRINSEFADRDGTYSTGAFGTAFDFDTSFGQTSYAVTGGADLLMGGEGDTAYVVGLTAGYAHSDVEFDASPNTAEFDGWTGGVYASFVSGGLFVDAIVNANKADLKNDIPALNLFPAGTILDTHLLSVGGQVEAGWRIPLGAVFVEPLASVSYVQTKYDDLEAPAGDPAAARIDIEFDDPTSLRASLGGRVGLEQDFGAVRAQVSGLLRVWNEFEGETTVTLQNSGADPVLTDDFSGQFTEVGVGASVYSAGGLVSGFLNLGGKFGDDYQATTASAGIRVSW